MREIELADAESVEYQGGYKSFNKSVAYANEVSFDFYNSKQIDPMILTSWAANFVGTDISSRFRQ
jgi:hypothetical protein